MPSSRHAGLTNISTWATSISTNRRRTLSDIPILDGEEWWSSKVSDDTASLLSGLRRLAESSIAADINIQTANIMLQHILEYDETSGEGIDLAVSLAYCESLLNTLLSAEAQALIGKIKEYDHAYFNGKKTDKR